MVVKTFRGLLADDGQDRIRLSTIKGKVGYRIIKFEIMPEKPFAEESEHVVKIFKLLQSSVDGLVNLTDTDLLAAAMINNAAGGYQNPSIPVIIFEQEIFNQDIYVTHSDVNSTDACNYYFELEVIPLDDAGAEYTTLKDMRST